MTALNKQQLREAATKAKELGKISRYTKAMVARLEFKEAATPDAVLALLDKLEDAEKRIAELEVRQVVLPNPPVVKYVSGEFIHCWPAYIVDSAIRAAGIITKVGE